MLMVLPLIRRFVFSSGSVSLRERAIARRLVELGKLEWLHLAYQASDVSSFLFSASNP